jgi:nitrile hydratase subunit alpha
MTDRESGQGQHHPRPLSGAALRAKAIESLLVEKGLLATDAIERVVEIYEKDVGPLNGAKVVARAWCDTGYKRRLLEDGTAGIAELGFGGMQGEQYAKGAQRDLLHSMLLLSMASARPAPDMVQVLGLSVSNRS